MMNLPTLTNRQFGVEIEFIGVNPQVVADAINNAGIEAAFEGYHHSTRPYWKIVTDASLSQGGHSAGEVVSPILKGETGARQLEKVLDAIDTVDGIRVDRSCGVHVHLDVNDLTVAQIQNTYSRYSDYESQIDLIMPMSRRGNSSRWCASVKSQKSTVTRKTRKSKSQLANTTGRYYKVNLQSLTRYGTMEFRQHSGTLNFTKVINWVSFLMAFVDTSASLTQATRTRPSSNRAFHLIRNAAANLGLDMEWSRGVRAWNITGEIDGTRYYAQYYNGDLNACYDGARETNLNVTKLYHLFRDHGLPVDASGVIINTNNPTVEVVEQTVTTDAGWLTGVDETVQRYFAERQSELN